MGASIPRLSQRLKCMKERLKFQEDIVEVKPDIANGTEGCKEVLKCNKFHKFLELLLLTSNYMNTGTKNGQAYGFDIKDLLGKVGNTKTAAGNMTMTHFLAEMISNKFPEIQGWEKEMAHIKEASRVSDEQITKTVNQLSASLSRCTNEL